MRLSLPALRDGDSASGKDRLPAERGEKDPLVGKHWWLAGSLTRVCTQSIALFPTYGLWSHTLH